MRKLNENRTRARFEKSKRTNKQNACFIEVVLKACDEMCGKKSRRDRGDMW